MSIALITAGGTGSRTGNSVPKQFLTVNDVPIIVYTMKNVQDSGCYDSMYVICEDGWKNFVTSYAEQYHIDIFKGSITGGDSRFASVSNGINYLTDIYESSVFVSLIDANRPLTTKTVFEESIRLLDNADIVLPLEPCFDSMYIVENDSCFVNRSIDRNMLYKGQSPETFRLGKAFEIHKRAYTDGILGLTTSALMVHYGERVAFTKGLSTNFKITTAEDLAIFKALAFPLI